MNYRYKKNMIPLELKAYSIGELSQVTSVSIETIRYYEKIEIIPKADRTAGGNRQYGHHQIAHLSFVKNCRDLGFTLNEIRDLSTLMDAEDFCCAHLFKATQTHKEKIREKITQLNAMLAKLETMTDRCSESTSPSCSVIEDLYLPSGH